MRIRKLMAQKKVCQTLPSSTPTTIPVIPASSTVQCVPTICEEEEERVNNLQTKKEEVVGVCELNMSVWDVIPAKDLLYYFSDEDFKDLNYEEEDYDDDYDDDDKIVDESVNAEEDQISFRRNGIEPEDDDEKTKEEELVEKQYATAYKRKLWLKSLTKKNNEKRKRDCHDDIDSNVKEEKKKKENGVVYCCKTDGQGWHCRSKAQKGKPLCKHHLIQMQRNLDHQRDNNQEKKIQKLEKKTARRGRPPKESNTTNTTTTIRGRKNKGKLSGKKSSEFVYYSGFGPLWGKNKRGRPPNEVKKQQEDAEEEDAKEEECEKLEEKQEVIDEAPLIDDPTSPKMNIVKEDNNNGCMFIDDEFESDDDDSDEDCNGVNVRKRYRKPIKARSLASLF
ncbi:hypothetical protein C5167_004622 [Papaver somniferum]|uniref:WRC domain-containing protein n=1 Tax=Papaver somniferum TaxID=3469 RepID=A0A4Y7J9Z5_PAPSO|nr:stress response protein nst1-like [Papaver somniferum]RZC57316.1 hypothetical protein C5167_004622 [Papaver somniferum]